MVIRFGASAVYINKGEKMKELNEYLNSETQQGKTEFRLVTRDLGDGGTKIYIHPIGKDGKTFDALLKGEEIVAI